MRQWARLTLTSAKYEVWRPADGELKGVGLYFVNVYKASDGVWWLTINSGGTYSEDPKLAGPFDNKEAAYAAYAVLP
jgi:hypothetical protein